MFCWIFICIQFENINEYYRSKLLLECDNNRFYALLQMTYLGITTNPIQIMFVFPIKIIVKHLLVNKSKVMLVTAATQQ